MHYVTYSVCQHECIVSNLKRISSEYRVLCGGYTYYIKKSVQAKSMWTSEWNRTEECFQNKPKLNYGFPPQEIKFIRLRRRQKMVILISHGSSLCQFGFWDIQPWLHTTKCTSLQFLKTYSDYSKIYLAFWFEGYSIFSFNLSSTEVIGNSWNSVTCKQLFSCLHSSVGAVGLFVLWYLDRLSLDRAEARLSNPNPDCWSRAAWGSDAGKMSSERSKQDWEDEGRHICFW